MTFVVTIRDGQEATERRIEATSAGFAAWVALGALVLGDRAKNAGRDSIHIDVKALAPAPR